MERKVEYRIEPITKYALMCIVTEEDGKENKPGNLGNYATEEEAKKALEEWRLHDGVYA
jgi:hypothetical protein